VQLIEIRGVYKKIGMNTNAGQESAHAPEFLSRLNRLAQDASGEPPLPKRPDIKHLTDIANRVGNDQLKVIHDNKDRLTKEIAAWQKRKELIADREPRWRELKRLLDHAVGQPVGQALQPDTQAGKPDLHAVATELEPEVKAIEDHRRLLDDPDPVPGMVDKLTEALRKALNEAHAACTAAHEQGLSGLEATDTWQKLTPEQRYETLSKHSVRQLPAIAVGTTDEVLATLQKTKVSELQAICDALPTRFSNASASAAKLLEPKAQSVSLPSRTIKNDDDLRQWLATVENAIREKLKGGPVIV
jgi:hypothetical protein